MPSQEFGDGQIILQFLQRFVELCLMRILRFLPRECPVLPRPLRTVDRQKRKPRLAQQAVRDRSLAMDEFGTAFRRVSEFRSRKRMDTPAAPVSRFQHRHLPAGSSEFAGGHQACGACADYDDVVWMWSGHARALPTGCRPISAFWIRYRSNIAPPSKAWLLSSVIAVMGARRPTSASAEAKTLGAPFAPSTAGHRIKLSSSTNPARRKAPLAPPPPSSSSRFTPSSRLKMSSARARSSSDFPAKM